MTISAGSRLGPYEVIAPIGAGGMGEVFKGRDTRLDRSVAIKILPSHLSSNPQLRERFDREARTISSLNHPNICTLYDVGSEGETDYLVMELLEGESLADRITRGPLPFADVLRYGADIASALDRAHRAGIVHRDLKPGNVMITKSGAKLLDFGLAKTATGASSCFSAAAATTALAAPTQQKPLTEQGTVVGTLQYMAPEQLAGEEADASTDIFALGAVLYEMATGHRAFDGKTRTSLVASIVAGEPRPMRDLQPLTPPAFEHVVTKCLAKERERRWQGASDIADELRWIGESGSEAGVAAPVAARRRNRERLVWMLHAATAVVAALLAWAWFAAHEPAKKVVETSIPPPPGYRFGLFAGAIVISPDASAIVFVLNDSKGFSLGVRPLSSSTVTVLPGTEEGTWPFWSADSKQIGFFASGKLKIIDAAGGPVQTIADAPTPRGGAWGTDGTILFAPDSTGPLMKVSSTGGTPVPATKLAPGELNHRWPAFFPDEKRFVYTATTSPVNGTTKEGSLDDVTAARTIVQGSPLAFPQFPGWILFSRGRALIAQRLSRSHELTGTPVVLADGVGSGNVRALSASVASDGTVVFARGPGFIASELVWVDRGGRDLEKVSGHAVFFCPTLSHDGRRLAVDISDPDTGSGDVWIYDLERKRSSRLTYDPGNETSPLWTPDDKHIVYTSDARGKDDLYETASGGTGTPQLLVASNSYKRTTDISSDGRTVIFNTGINRNSPATDIWVYSMTDKTARPWLATPFGEATGKLSPDGRWIAYQSNESGRSEVYVRAFPDSDEKYLVSNNGGTMASWRGDGREIYYLSADQKMMAVPVKPGPGFEPGTPAALFDAPLRLHIAKQYDVTPDGNRFILNRRVEESGTEPLTVLQNWTARFAK